MKLAIIGGGSWGTALAIVLAPRSQSLRLWAFEEDLVQRMIATRENDVFLPGFKLPEPVEPTSDLSHTLADADIVLSVMPSKHVRCLYEEMLPHLRPGTIFVSATKGISREGGLFRISQVIQAVTAKLNPHIAVLSGPSFAREVARGDPSAVVVASYEREIAEHVQAAFSGPTFRLYTNNDPVGVEVGGALKNVIAICAGICEGLGLGSNTQAALMTRGLAEITRLALAMGAEPLTLSGLAGLGDLVLTCSGGLSRNRQLGIGLAQGRTLTEIVNSTRMVAEGVETCESAVLLAKQHDVDLPITKQMWRVLHGHTKPQQAIRELMDRSLKSE